mmetsp:Transcript_28796/g.73401  ORF Transcript_28796/g.73401 Transcript_28796/m.73401 type:complete len:396 (+) Transcript_28796:770-1957(+)
MPTCPQQSRLHPYAGARDAPPVHQFQAPAQLKLLSAKQRLRGVADGLEQRVVRAVHHGPGGLHAQVARDAVRAAKAAEHHCVHALPRECRVAHAVQALHGGAVEGHGEHAQGAARGDGAVRAVMAVQEAAVRARRAHLLEAHAGRQAGEHRVHALNELLRHQLLLGLVLVHAHALPRVNPVGRERVHNVLAGGRQRVVQQRGQRHKQRAVGVLHLGPVLEDDVVAVGVRVAKHGGVHAHVQREERGRLLVALAEQLLARRQLALAQHRLERVPARGVGDDGLAAVQPPVRQAHARRAHGVALALRHNLLDVGLVHHVGAALRDALHKRLGDAAHTPQWIVDATIVAVAKHHARVDHGREVGVDGGPDVALQVDKLEQGGVAEVAARHVTRVDDGV